MRIEGKEFEITSLNGVNVSRIVGTVERYLYDHYPKKIYLLIGEWWYRFQIDGAVGIWENIEQLPDDEDENHHMIEYRFQGDEIVGIVFQEVLLISLKSGRKIGYRETVAHKLPEPFYQILID